jgi:hypothetical protein
MFFWVIKSFMVYIKLNLARRSFLITFKEKRQLFQLIRVTGDRKKDMLSSLFSDNIIPVVQRKE